MKNHFRGLLVILFALMVFIPASVYALDSYEYFDFRVERVDGAVIKDTKVRIFASVETDPGELTDRTNEFNVVDMMWSECVDVDCALSEEVTDDAVFEANKDYVLMIVINAKNGADINVWSTDRVMFNGVFIENLAGEYGNTGNELMIKTRTNVNTSTKVEDTKIDEPIEEPAEPVITTGIADENTCIFGLSLCCTTFLGLSLCIWILIAIVLLLLVIAVCVLKCNKKKEE